MRSGEFMPAVLLFLAFFLFITFQYAAKSVRESTFISSLGAEKLPMVYLAVALFSYPILRLYARFADKLARHVLIAGTCSIVATSLVLFWWLFQFENISGAVSTAFYVWVSVVFVMTVSQFWSFANHVFDPRQAKRLFGFVGAGGLLGGLAGGQVARIATNLLGTRYALLVSAFTLGLAVLVILVLHRMHHGDEAAVAGAAGMGKLDKAKGGFDVIRKSRMLQMIAAVLVTTVVVANIVDLQFKYAVDASITGLDAQTVFFGNFFSIMNISAFIFQLLLTSRIHRALGVGFAMRVLPSVMAVGTVGLFMAAASGIRLLYPAVILKVGENGLRYSLDQATRQLLYLPVPSKARLTGMAFIDVFIQRGAKGLAAILLLPVTFGLMTAIQAGWISLAIIVLWFFVIAFTYREYVRSFRSGLKRRTMDSDTPVNLSDITTLELLIQSLGSSDARQVLHSLDLMAANGRGNLVPPLLLYHDDADVRCKTLEILADVGRTDAGPLVERRLGDENPDVRAEAIRVLVGFYGEDAVKMMVPRLSEADPGVRAAAVACLATHGDDEMAEKAAKALREMLLDADPNVRAEAAKATGAIPEPRFQESLIQLLYDTEPEVVREAIAAVRRRVARDGYNPLYMPTLTSLLQNRKVKHEVREALVAFGKPAIPALTHFMNDTAEPVWVRRALPKTIVRIGTPESVQALLDCLEQPVEPFLRRKVVEALGGLDENLRASITEEQVLHQVEVETRRFFQTLQRLCALGLEEKGKLQGGTVVWTSEDDDPTLVDKLLIEALADDLYNVFGLLALKYPARDVWAAHLSLASGQVALRNHALEYLDNTLSADLRKLVFTMIGDAPLEDKLLKAQKSWDIGRMSKAGALEEILLTSQVSQEVSPALVVGSLYSVYSDRVKEVYPRVGELRESEDGMVRETAGWVIGRLGLATG